MNISPQHPGLSSTDESSVRKLVSEFANTWNRHDMKGMHDLDTEDVEWINITGNHWCGKPTVFKGHDNIHKTIFAKTDMTVVSAVVRAIAPNVAIAVATMTFDPVPTPTGDIIRNAKTRGSFVMVKRDGAWKIAHFHNTSVDPIAEQNDPATWDATGWLPGKSA